MSGTFMATRKRELAFSILSGTPSRPTCVRSAGQSDPGVDPGV